MSYKNLLNLIKSFDKNYEQATEWASKNIIRGDNIVVLPIPIVPDTEGLTLPDDCKVSELGKYFSSHPDQGIIISVGTIFNECDLASGHKFEPKAALYQEGTVVTILLKRFVNPLFYKGTIMYVIKPGDIISFSNNKFKKEDYDFKSSS